MTVKEVQAALKRDDKYTTVMTVMQRLSEKGVLCRERVGLHYEYWKNSAQTQTTSFLAQLKQKMLGVKTAEMVSYLIEQDNDISLKELQEMEELIQQAKRKKS